MSCDVPVANIGKETMWRVDDCFIHFLANHSFWPCFFMWIFGCSLSVISFSSQMIVELLVGYWA